MKRGGFKRCFLLFHVLDLGLSRDLVGAGRRGGSESSEGAAMEVINSR